MLKIDTAERTLTLVLTIDQKFGSMVDYFEIFLDRMLLCRRAAKFFDYTFRLMVNGAVMM